MSRFFKRLPLHIKLSLVVLVPLLCMIYFAIQILIRQTDEVASMKHLQEGVQQSVSIMKIVEEVQLERRYTISFFMSANGNSNDLVLQRSKTDAAIHALEATLGEPSVNFERNSLLSLLPGKRRQIDNNELNQHAAMSYFSALILRLNSLTINILPDAPATRMLNPRLRAEALLSQMTTYLSNMRLDLYMLMIQRESVSGDIERMENNLAIYQSLVAEFNERAPEDAKTAFNKVAGSAAYRNTMAVIENYVRYGKLDLSLKPEDWWTSSITGLVPVKDVEQAVVASISEHAQQIYERQQGIRTRNFVVLILLVGLVIYIIGITLRNLAAQLQELQLAAERIASGATGVKLPPYSRDAIGLLSRAFSKIDQTNSQLAGAADHIGQGHFNVLITPRSDEDMLGNALVRMRNDLKTYHENNERIIWVQTGLNELNEKLIGDADIATLSITALQSLAAYLDVKVGVMYVRQQEWLHYAAGYALNDRFPVQKTIQLGKTLLGEAAEQQRIMQLEYTADDFIKISTAASESVPAHTLILPLVHNRQVEGVIEIGATQPFAPATMDFVKEAANRIAIALQSARSRQRLQELLEETQAQSEELQTQHSELEGLNTELTLQTQKLQASDEELRVQQEELQQNNAELEERSRLLEEKNELITTRNLDIQRQSEALAQSTRYKSEFMANMSHELRTPLNSILLLSRLLQENNEENLNHDQVEYAQVIQQSGKGLLTLIDEILDLSKIESGKMELEYQSLKPALIIEDMRSIYDPMAREKDLKMEWTVLPSTPVYFDTDRLRLEQVLKNLLSNALKFTAKGTITLQVSALGPQQIEFRVQDQGIGIAKEKQDLVFEAFRQADGTTRRKYGGTGLGLSISREITKLLGGHISVESEEGKGSTFIVVLPVTKPATTAPANNLQPVLAEHNDALSIATATSLRTEFIEDFIPEPVPDDREVVQPGDKTILIIEDDTAFAKALLDYTRARGYKGLVSVRGDQGIQLARQYRPQGILLDIRLPVKDGWQVMDALKSDPLTRPIPVHMMSSMEMKKESLHKGAIDFINKPVAFDQLQDVFGKLEYVLNKHPKKVLIVEENAQHAKALAYFLSTYQVNTEISDNIADGVQVLAKQDIDCVILDMGIPDPKAYETLEAVKTGAGMESVPVIIFTGKSLSKSEEQRIRNYADSIVIKTAHSYQRLLDEISLFLHLVEEQSVTDGRSKTPRISGMNEVLNGKTVLVADDDVRNIFSLTKSLEKSGMNVLSATDGEEALSQLSQHPVDVVLMDMMMPEMDGYQTIGHIRANRKLKNLPVIAVTAKAMMGDREKCIAAGASDYISKPVDVDQLLSLLRVWLYDKGKKY